MSQLNPEETSPLLVAEASVGKRRNCFTVIKEEFRLKNFGFNFENEGVFYKSQWQWPRIVFVLFRLSLAIYTGTICVLSVVYFPHQNPHRPWPVWMTNWTYLLLTCHEILAAVIVLVHLNEGAKGCCSKDDVNDDDDDVKDDVIGFQADDVKPLPCYMKLDWLFFCIIGPVAMSVTFNRLVFAEAEGFETNIKDINNHIMVGFVTLLEYCIGAIPVRLFHFVYVVIYFTVYHLFSYVFWSFDHTNNVLYPHMDWDDAGNVVVGWVFMALVFGGIMQIVAFALYRLRLLVYSKAYKREERDYETIYVY